MSYLLTAEEQQRVVSWLDMSDGSRRAFYHWPASSRETIARLLIIPGLGEHGGRYAECGEFFSNRGFDTFSIDMIGHGLSPGKRGCIKSYDSLLDDIEKGLETVAARAPELPVVLWGHSMGGNLVVNYLLRRGRLPMCAIATGPMLRASRLPSKAFMWFARRLALLWPNYCLVTPASSRDCTRDPKHLERMHNDRLFHKKVSLLLGMHLIDTGQWALANANRLHTKLLIMHGKHDAVTSSQGSQEFAEQSGDWCEYRSLPNHLHDLHRDVDSDAILGSMADWLIEQVQKKS